MREFFLKKENQNIILASLVFIVIMSYIGIQLYTQEYIRGSVADDAYYLAVGNSLFKNGHSQDVTVFPARYVLNAHWGIALVYGLLSFVGLNFIGVSITTMFIGLILHFSSIYPLIQLAKRFDLSETVAWFILIILSLSSYYINPVLVGRTESFFFPIALFWVNEVFKWGDGNRKPVLIIILSVVLISFRMQALIYFGAMVIAFLCVRKWKESVKIIAIFLSSIIFVYVFNFLISGYFSSRGEASVTKAISIIKYDIWLKNIEIISGLLLALDNKLSKYISIFVLIFLVIACVVVLVRKWRIETVFANVLIGGAFLSFILVMPNAAKAGHLRYISYVIPFLMLLSFYSLSLFKHTKLILPIVLTFICLIQLKQIGSEIKHIDYELLKNKRSINRYNEFHTLFKGFENKVYGFNLVGYETHRLFYSATLHSLRLIDSPELLANKSGYLISTVDKKEELSRYIEEPEYYFSINNEYFVARLKN